MSRIPGAIVLAMVLLLLAMPAGLYAQRGSRSGGVAAVHSAPVSSFAGRPAPVVSSGGINRPIGNRPIGIGRPYRPIIVTQPFGYYPYYGYSYGSYGYSPYYSTPVGVSAYADPAYAYTEPAYAQPPAYVSQAPAVSPNEADLTYQIGMLSQQIEQLRQEQARSAPPAPAQSAAAAVLIFRDGHRQEIHNFAIVGDTLWVLDERTSTKISVADLDIDATQKENRSHGVRFPLPAR